MGTKKPGGGTMDCLKPERNEVKQNTRPGNERKTTGSTETKQPRLGPEALDEQIQKMQKRIKVLADGRARLRAARAENAEGGGNTVPTSQCTEGKKRFHEGEHTGGKGSGQEDQTHAGQK